MALEIHLTRQTSQQFLIFYQFDTSESVYSIISFFILICFITCIKTSHKHMHKCNIYGDVVICFLNAVFLNFSRLVY